MIRTMDKLRAVTRYFAAVFYRPLLIKWLSKERKYSYGSIKLNIHPQVFHPGFFFSTRILLRFLDGSSLKGKRLLELGAGSGIISIMAAKAGAVVTASDINPVATTYLQQNSFRNEVKLTVTESDLFEAISPQLFDLIVINPPYYFETPVTMKDHAWFCGKDGGYFIRLFAGISNYIDQNTVILMILCEGSDRRLIQEIAGNSGFSFECLRTVSNLIERNYIYQVRFLNNGSIPVKDEQDIIIQSQEQ